MRMDPFLPPMAEYQDIDTRQHSNLMCMHVSFIVAVIALCVSIGFLGYGMASMREKLDVMIMLMKAVHDDTRGMCQGMNVLGSALGHPINVTCH